jgi:uncharacterized protein (DUF362 family)
MGERVALVRCPATASDAAVEAALLRAAELVGDVGAGLRNKKKVLIKPNLGTDDVRLHQGRQVALTDPSVLAATVRLIRRFHSGDIVIGDATTGSSCYDVWRQVGHDRALRDLDVRVVDFKEGPYIQCEVPGGGIMFDRYWMNHEFADADAIVSVAKLKSHVLTGSTGTLKNLFGMTPTLHYGSPRRYLHAPVRLPRAIADLGLAFPPVLCVIDGLVGQSEREWHGPPVETGLRGCSAPTPSRPTRRRCSSRGSTRRATTASTRSSSTATRWRWRRRLASTQPTTPATACAPGWPRRRPSPGPASAPS